MIALCISSCAAGFQGRGFGAEGATGLSVKVTPPKAVRLGDRPALRGFLEMIGPSLVQSPGTCTVDVHRA